MFNDFYDESEPIVRPEAFYGEQKFLVEKCLVIFSSELHSYLLNNYRCEQIALITACNGDVPIYALEYKGEKIAFYLSATGSAISASFVSEANWITGATKFVMFGSCGSLDNDKTKGRFIVPTESYRGEGASFYYVPASEYITIKTADQLAQIFETLRMPYVKGRVWTTDSMIRETKGLVARRKAEGCIAVDMELSGVQALCDFYGFTLYNFMEAGDVLDEHFYEAEGLKGANHNIYKLLIALEVALRI